MAQSLTFDTLFEFEDRIAEYTGAPYAVVTDGCTHAIELCMRYDEIASTQFTAFTYLSVPMLMHRLGIGYTLTNSKWSGEYQFAHTRIWDSARRLEHNMYRAGQLQCLSFGPTKPLEIGRCGAVLTDDFRVYQTLSRWRSDGRDLRIAPWQDQKHFEVGYHYCPSLEICQVGLEKIKTVEPQCQTWQYPDCQTITIKN